MFQTVIPARFCASAINSCTSYCSKDARIVNFAAFRFRVEIFVACGLWIDMMAAIGHHKFGIVPCFPAANESLLHLGLTLRTSFLSCFPLGCWLHPSTLPT